MIDFFDIKKPQNKYTWPIFREQLKKISNKLISISTSIVNFLTHPVFTIIIVLSQLFVGALLGADISIKISGNSHAVSGLNLTSFHAIWDNLYSLTKTSVISVMVLSIVKSVLDTLKNIIDQKEIEKINNDNKLLPSQLVLDHYLSSTLLKSQTEGEKLATDTSEQSAVEALERLLFLSKELISKWDDKPLHSYRCNLMFYLPSSSTVNKHLSEHWDNIKPFYDAHNAEAASKQISGVLVSIAALNDTFKDYFSPQKIRRKKPLLLPVCLDQAGLSTQSIPGAPEAYKTGVYQYLPDVLLDVSKWLKITQANHFTEEQKNAIYNFYLKDVTFRSLISIPCRAATDVITINAQNEEKLLFKANDIIAVLNIYSTNIGILSKNHKLFCDFLTPITNNIAKCCINADITTRKPF
ncbi:hypothetical protein I5Q20_13375 [Serratia marcescens]|nr:hypothetical protein [Serratia marcescens]